MASLVKTRQFLLVALVVCTLIFSVTSGYEGDYVPEIGIIGQHPRPGEDHGYGGTDEEPGAVDLDPTHIVDGALICFHKREIYSRCDESCRLTMNGELNVPHDQVDEFCNGPCIEEANLILDCIDGIMNHFFFFNKATAQDIRDTILAGCGHGDERGDFNVAKHIEAQENLGHKATISVGVVLSGIMLSIIGQVLLLI